MSFYLNGTKLMSLGQGGSGTSLSLIKIYNSDCGYIIPIKTNISLQDTKFFDGGNCELTYEQITLLYNALQYVINMGDYFLCMGNDIYGHCIGNSCMQYVDDEALVYNIFDANSEAGYLDITITSESCVSNINIDLNISIENII